ncbi:MAG: XdhC family protein [Magnetovibrio sp.]|nr:XdhC family protein [Magnetovibrio sp.]
MTPSAHDPLLQQAQVWADAGLGLALATVMQTWGSSPCPAGSLMVVNAETGFAGSVSGGCIETSVVSECLEIIRDGGVEVLEYGISDEQGAAAGLACGGTVRVLVELLTPDLLAQLMGPSGFARVVDVTSGTWSTVRDGITTGALALCDAALETTAQALIDERPCSYEDADQRYFIHPMMPPYQMIVIGAVRIAQALVPMAMQAGFEVTVIDPRKAFATQERFSDVNLICDWPDMALQDITLDRHTAVVTMIHDAKPDDMALALALRSEAFYIGSLGSRKTHAKRAERLHLFGFDQAAINRIHAPIGLDIGGRSPAEIAVSILAQVIAAKNQKLPLSGKTAS